MILLVIVIVIEYIINSKSILTSFNVLGVRCMSRLTFAFIIDDNRTYIELNSTSYDIYSILVILR